MKSLQVPYSSNRTFQHQTSAEPSSPHDHTSPGSHRRSPIDSLHPGTPTSITSRATAFFKRPRLRSASSVHSSSASDSASHENSSHPSNAHYSDAPSIVHPFSSMVAAPVPVVSNPDTEDEKDCPVCLEPLSFSFRLPGEKPHIVPDCGHALHEVRVLAYRCMLIISLSSTILLRHALQPSMAPLQTKVELQGASHANLI